MLQEIPSVERLLVTNVSILQGVFLSARVHPGESNSSWMMKGIIDFLTGESKES
jgi:hypothetical protein